MHQMTLKLCSRKEELNYIDKENFVLDDTLIEYQKRLNCNYITKEGEVDSHPGYKERLAKMRSFIAKYKTQLPSQTQNKTTPGEWNYDSDLNLLKFSPK